MDAFARGLKVAAKIRADGVFKEAIKKRYASWDGGIGQQIEQGRATFEDLEKYVLERGDAQPNVSGRQELLENVLNRYIELA
jgi:xylose isomerase